MSGYVKSPHLPMGKVGLCAIGERYRPQLGRALEALGAEPLWLPDAPGADGRVAGHADLSLLHLGGRLIVSSCSGKTDAELVRRGFELVSCPGPGREYPADCSLNACIAGGCFIHRLDITAPAALENAAGLELVNTAQGYAKCSACVVDGRSIMTADRGIAAAARKRGLDVLELSPGYVELEGFPYGFLGGACFKCAPDVMAFTGRIDGHPDFERIEAFLAARSIRPVYLTDRAVFDVGSVLPLTEL